MNSWHVRCWCGLREIENAGEASPYLDTFIIMTEKTKVSHFTLYTKIAVVVETQQ